MLLIRWKIVKNGEILFSFKNYEMVKNVDLNFKLIFT